MMKIKNWLYQKLMNNYYKQFKTCNLPCPFYDKKRNTSEWVMYDKSNKYFCIYSEINEALSNIASTGLTYHFKANIYTSDRSTMKRKNQITVSHVHNFNEIVNNLYNYPETFLIPDEYLDEYSHQQLMYLKKLKNYLLLIGLKDNIRSEELENLSKKYYLLHDKEKKTIFDKIKMHKYIKRERNLIKREKVARCQNVNISIYNNYLDMYIKDKKVLKAILNGWIDYRIFIKHPFSKSRINQRYFLIDDEENYHAILEIIKEEIIAFKDIKESMVNYKIKGFKTFKDYKENLYQKFKEDSKWYNEVFDENSKITYAKFKIVKLLNKR